MQRHFRTHCRPYQCPFVACRGRKFSRRADFVSHYRRHRGLKPVACRMCGREFTSTKLRSDHQAMIHPDPEVPAEPPPVFSCPVAGCAFSTTRKRYLAKHAAVHNRPHKCQSCPRAFATAAALAAHVSATHSPLHIECPHAHRGCTFRTNAGRYLTRHLARCSHALWRRDVDKDALATAVSTGRRYGDAGGAEPRPDAHEEVPRVHDGAPESR